MSLSVLNTQEISDTIIAQLEASISQTIPLLPKAFTNVLAKVLAGVVVLLYKYGGWIFLQLFVAHASMQSTTINGKTVVPLVLWGRLVGVGDPKPATRAELLITIPIKADGGKLLAGQQFLCTDTNVIYQAITETVISGAPGNLAITVRATYDQDDHGGAGAIGNLAAGATLQVVNGPPNLGTTATVAGATVTGADAETPASYRARITNRVQQRPQGGAFADYRDWALTVPGIVNAYPYTGDPGTVVTYIEADEASSGSADGIPTGAQQTAVLDAINLNDAGVATRRPVNAAPIVLPISRTTVDVVVTGLASEDGSDTAPVQTEISAGLDEYLRSLEPFIVGLSVLPRKDRITTSALGGVVDGIASASGMTVTSVSLSISGSPVTAITLGDGEKAKLNPAGATFV